MDSLPVGLRQRVEILKALRGGARVLLLDEPTAVLTPQETRDLFVSLREMTAGGMTIVFITHKLAEVKAVADRVTVLRGGRVTGRVEAADVTPSQIAELMVGRPVAYVPAPRRAPAAPPLVEVRDLTVIDPQGVVRLDRVSLDIRPGEILGIAGVEGNGQTELAQALGGLLAPAAGEGRLGGAPFTGRGVAAARRLGVAWVPEDRIHDGIAAEMSIAENFVATRYGEPRFARGPLLRAGRVAEAARAMIAAFEVRTPSERTPIASLSGGNMQKVILAREFDGAPRLILAAQPTRGVDIGAAEGLRQRLVDRRDAGAAVLLISADLEEVMALSDRIAVLFDGRIVAHAPADALDENALGLFMLGARRQDGASALLPAPEPPSGSPSGSPSGPPSGLPAGIPSGSPPGPASGPKPGIAA